MTAAQPRRTHAQARYETAWHEAGHAVAAYLAEIPLKRIELMDESGNLVDGDKAGCVFLGGPESANVHEAEDTIVVDFAGEACVRIAWVLGNLAEDLFGRVATTELTVDDIMISRNGSTPAAAAAYYGADDDAGSPDELHAHELAVRWASGLEAAWMLAYLRERTINLVQSDRFQHLASNIAAALLDQGALSGEFATQLLERADAVFVPTSTEGG